MTLCVDHKRRGHHRAVRKVSAIIDAAIGTRSRVDPTGTTNVRRRWEAEITRRVGGLRSLVAESVVNVDLLGLSGSAKATVGAAVFARAFAGFGPGGEGLAALVPSPSAPPDDKAAAFVSWFYDEQLRRVLGVNRGFDRATAPRLSWMRTFVDLAYGKGVRDALAARGVTLPEGALSQEPHASKLGLARAKAFGDVEGIIDAMSTVVSRVVLQALGEGWTPERAARELNLQAIERGLVRARTFVRTETVRIYNEAALDALEALGETHVRVFAEGVPGVRTDGVARDYAGIARLATREVEYVTSGDDDVCPVCQIFDGEIFTLRQARGLIPQHPNCRCSFIPVDEEDDDD